MCWPEPLSASSPQLHHVLQHQGPHIYLYPCSSKSSCLHKVQRSIALTGEKGHGVVKHLKRGGPKWFNRQVNNTENKIKNRIWKTNPGNYSKNLTNIWYKDLFINLGLMTNSSREIQNEAPCSCPWSAGRLQDKQTSLNQREGAKARKSKVYRGCFYPGQDRMSFLLPHEATLLDPLCHCRNWDKASSLITEVRGTTERQKIQGSEQGKVPVGAVTCHFVLLTIGIHKLVFAAKWQ